MHLDTFVKALQEDLNGFKKNNKTNNGNLLVDLESDLTIRQLEALLSEYANAKSVDDIVNTPKALDPFVNFLATRWDRIVDTDAIPMHSPHTLATRMCAILAKRLSAELHKDPLHFLIPKTLKATQSDVTNVKYSDAKFQEYVLTDGNDYLLEVAACLTYAANNRGAFRTTTRIDGLQRRDLTEAEINRVKNHSQLTQNYYQAMVANGYVDKNGKIQEEKNKLTDTIGKESYSVIASYGKEGEKKLDSRLIAKRDELFANREQLLSYMTKNLKKTEWDAFLRGFKNPETLNKLLLGNGKFDDVLTSKSSYNQNEDHDKALLFCMLDYYWRQRNSQKEFSSIIGRVTGLAWSKTNKEIGVQVLKEFLVSKRNLSELDAFLDIRIKEKGKEFVRDIIYSFGGNLKMIADEVTVVSKLIVDHQQQLNTKPSKVA